MRLINNAPDILTSYCVGFWGDVRIIRLDLESVSGSTLGDDCVGRIAVRLNEASASPSKREALAASRIESSTRDRARANQN